MKKILFTLILFTVIISLVSIGCQQQEKTAGDIKPSATAPSITTTTKVPNPAATTAAAPKGEMYGGILREAMISAPARPIGYPAEGVGISHTAGSPAIERLLRTKIDGSSEGVLATAWEVDSASKSITLTLRKGVKFHDNSDFNAEVCKWNLDQQIEAKTARTWLSVDIIDEYTIRINLESFTNMDLSDLAGPTTSQISKEFAEKNGLDAARWNPVGTGPFMFESYERDAKLTYKRNPNYWDAPKPYLDGVEMVIITDATVQQLAFQKGDIHILRDITPQVSRELEDTGSYNVKTDVLGPADKILYPDSMNPKSPWADVRVRYAASYALDRESLAEALGFGYAIPAYQIMQGFKELQVPGLIKTTYNPDKAKALLKESGYPKGFKTTIHNSVVIPNDYVSAIAAQFRDVGIDTSFETPTRGLFEEMRYGTWDGLMSHGLGVWENWNKSFSSYFMGLQYRYVKRPAGFEEGVIASLAAPEQDPELIKNVIKIMYDDMMIIPYMETLTTQFNQKGLHNQRENEFGTQTILYAEYWLEKQLR